MPLFGLLCALLLSMCAMGCTPADPGFGIELENLRVQRAGGGLEIRAHQEVRLSSEARAALQHGVPLRLRIDLALGGAGARAGADGGTFNYEIRYLPLSELYQLSGPSADGAARTYPRLRHVLAALEDVELRLRDFGDLPGPVVVRMRSRLDRGGMPGPMQLPMLLSPQWKHDSGWVSRELDVNG